MAGIGDYIHYSNINYKKHGTLREGGSNYSESADVFNRQRDKVLKQIYSTKSKSLTELETSLNNFIYNKIDPNGTAIDQKIIEGFRQKVYSELSTRMSNIGINFDSNLSVYQIVKPLEIKENSVKTEQIKKMVLQMEQHIANMQNNFTNLAVIEKWQNMVKQMQNLISQGSNNSDIIILNNDNQVTLNNINEFLKVNSLPTNKALGDSFEQVLASIQPYLAEYAKLETDKMLTTEVIGQQTGNTKISLNKLSKYVDTNQLVHFLNNKSWKVNDNTTLTLKGSQGKADVILNWNGDQLNISAKNYSLQNYKNIHIVSGISLFSLIMNEDSSFINHWLNTVTVNKNKTNTLPHIQLAHQAMKATILVKGLTGQGLGRSQVADTFILNNRSKRKIEVYSMSDIANKVNKDLDKYLHLTNYPKTILQTWVGSSKAFSEMDAQIRITQLLAKLDSYKISASIDYNSFS